MGRNKNKSLKIALIVIASILVIAGIFVGIYFALMGGGIRYYEVQISNGSGVLTLNTNQNQLSPDAVIITRPITIGLDKKSSTAFIRAKVVFENESEDNRVLSFVNQLNYAVKDIETYIGENYHWEYNLKDNSFYLMGNENFLKSLSPNDNNFNFVEKLIVPSSLEQINSLNSEGNNVQIGENIIIRVIFEAVQSSDLLGTKKPTIENVRELFNNFSSFSENDFTSENGFLTSYKGNSKTLILPKFVGDDYIIGIKSNAFSGKEIQKIIVPGNYIHFDENCFYGITDLQLVALKSETPINLSATSFTSKSNFEIYTTKNLHTYVKNNYPTLSYINNFVIYTEINSGDLNLIQNKTVKAIYAPNLTEFNGTFSQFTSLKVLVAPSLTKINDNAFTNLINLVDVDTPNVTEIGKNAFYNCISLLNTSFSKNLTTLGEKSFYGCTTLPNINFSKNLKAIPTECFRNCSNLKNVTLLNENLEIENGAFYNCNNLKIVNIKNIKKAGDYSFSNCSALKTINLKNFDIENISETAFASLNLNIVNFVFDSNVNTTNFINKFTNFATKTITVTILNKTLTSVQGNVTNVNITEFNFFNEITTLGNNIFKDNNTIISIVIPTNIKNIGYGIVNNCSNLNSVTFTSPLIPTMHEKIFEGAKTDLTIYVPNGMLNVYKQALSKFNLNILAK